MGGGLEVDEATLSFLAAARGGDVVVLRASGSTSSYNDYFLSALEGDSLPASTTTLRVPASSTAASSPGVLCRVGRAEGIWLAGGDQWDYLGGWAGPLHDSVAATAIRGKAVGGTSAGAMVLGEVAFAATFGGVTSAEALAAPTAAEVTVRISAMSQPELRGVLVDSHFHARDREGRLLAFLAQGRALLGRDTLRGIGIDERTALVVRDGLYHVHAVGAGVVSLYEVTGDAVLEPGRALGLTGIRRLHLRDGDRGAWPPAFPAGVATAELRVVDGVVRVVQPPPPPTSGAPAPEAAAADRFR
jgi:beta-aspartyl-peptidase (threonine type)